LRKVGIALALASLAVAFPAAAQGHVSVQPDEAPAGGFVRLDVRVPNEKEEASTTKVDVRFPPGFIEASTEPVPGWTAKVKKTKLVNPQKNDEGETITERVSEITWSGGKIRPGEFQDFGLSVQVPGKGGDTLTFKAIQTYDNGETVRWIGAPGSEEPAPQVKVTAAEPEGGAATTTSGTEAKDDGEDDDSKGLAIAAIIAGGLGLVAGGAALVSARRRS
jgi:periplasmic copper chaperone A